MIATIDFIEDLQEELKAQKNDTQKVFKESADRLLNSTIDLDGKKFELTEIEFYYFNCENHPDTYVHLDPIQKEKNKFYVHKKPWDRAGIDLTFGNGKYFGGILIRGIKVGDTFVAGPATVKEEIASWFNITKDEGNKELENKLNSIKHSFIENTEKKDIAVSDRVGLTADKDKEFANKNYRFARSDYLDDTTFYTRRNLKEITKLQQSLK